MTFNFREWQNQGSGSQSNKMFKSCNMCLRTYCLWLHCVSGLLKNCFHFSILNLFSSPERTDGYNDMLLEKKLLFVQMQPRKANQNIADNIELRCEFEPLFTLGISAYCKALPLNSSNDFLKSTRPPRCKLR